jgi:hypothetical protein
VEEVTRSELTIPDSGAIPDAGILFLREQAEDAAEFQSSCPTIFTKV